MTEIHYQPRSANASDDLDLPSYDSEPNYAMIGSVLSGVALLGLALSSKDEIKMALGELGLGPRSWRRRRGFRGWLDSLSDYASTTPLRTVNDGVEKARPYVESSAKTMTDTVVPGAVGFASDFGRWLFNSGSNVVRQAADQAPRVGKAAGEYAAETGKYAKDLSTSLYERLPDRATVSDVTSRFADTGYQYTSEYGSKGAELAKKYGKKAAERTSEYTALGSEYASEGAELAKKYGKKAAERTSEYTALGSEYASEGAKTAADTVRGFNPIGVLTGFVGAMFSGLFNALLFPPRMLLMAVGFVLSWVFGTLFSFVWNFGWIGLFGWVVIVAYYPEQEQRDQLFGQARGFFDDVSGFVSQQVK